MTHPICQISRAIGTGIKDHTGDFLSPGNHKIKAMPLGVQSEGRAVGICGAIVSYIYRYILSWCRRRRSWLPHDIVSDMRWWYIKIYKICSVLYISMHPSIHTLFPSVRLLIIFTSITFDPQDAPAFYWGWMKWKSYWQGRPRLQTQPKSCDARTKKSCQWTSMKSARGASIYSTCLQGSLQ